MAEAEVAEALKVTSDDGLLNTYAALTHQMQAVRRNKAKVAKLRLQRNLVRDEILERMKA